MRERWTSSRVLEADTDGGSRFRASRLGAADDKRETQQGFEVSGLGNGLRCVKRRSEAMKEGLLLFNP